MTAACGMRAIAVHVRLHLNPNICTLFVSSLQCGMLWGALYCENKLRGRAPVHVYSEFIHCFAHGKCFLNRFQVHEQHTLWC